MEAESIEALTPENNPGFKEMKSKEIQEYGPDIMAADHLLELCKPHVHKDTSRRNESQLTMIRHFVQLLRDHAREIDSHCTGLEAEVTSDHSHLEKSLVYLDDQVRNCLEEFERLKETGVHSLAPPMPSLPRPGTFAAREAQQQSMLAPGALLRAIDVHTQPAKPGSQPPEPPMLTNGNMSNEMMALSNMPALGNLAIQNQPAAQVMGNSNAAGGMLGLRDAGAADNQTGQPSALMDNVR